MEKYCPGASCSGTVLAVFIVLVQRVDLSLKKKKKEEASVIFAGNMSG